MNDELVKITKSVVKEEKSNWKRNAALGATGLAGAAGLGYGTYLSRPIDHEAPWQALGVQDRQIKLGNKPLNRVSDTKLSYGKYPYSPQNIARRLYIDNVNANLSRNVHLRETNPELSVWDKDNTFRSKIINNYSKYMHNAGYGDQIKAARQGTAHNIKFIAETGKNKTSKLVSNAIKFIIRRGK